MLRARAPRIRPIPPYTLLQRTWRGVARRLGLTGNIAFLVGSLLFLSDTSQTAGVWCFILGSALFLIDGLRPPKPE